MRKRNPIEMFVLIIKGLIMGLANKVPGISGGMIALVGGFYEELMYTMQKFNGKAFSLLFKGNFSTFLRYINSRFIFPIGFGIILAFFTVSLLLDFFMKEPNEGGLGLKTEVWAYFFGLILGSIYYITKKSVKWTKNDYIGYFLGATVGLVISFIEPFSPNLNLWFVFFCGIVSVSGVALPGFSGSFLLVIFGNYTLIMVDSINNLLYFLFKLFSGDVDLFHLSNSLNSKEIELLKVFLVFSISSFFGVVIFSKIMGYLLKRFHNTVIAILVGFITGSLGASWPWKNEIIREADGVLVYERFLPLIDFGLFSPIFSIFLGFFTLVLILYLEKSKSNG